MLCAALDTFVLLSFRRLAFQVFQGSEIKFSCCAASDTFGTLNYLCEPLIKRNKSINLNYISAFKKLFVHQALFLYLIYWVEKKRMTHLTTTTAIAFVMPIEM